MANDVYVGDQRELHSAGARNAGQQLFVTLDYITGVAAAYKTKTLKSSIGFEGLFKKGAIFRS